MATIDPTTDSSVTLSNPFVGVLFGENYRARRLIGRGGMGLVYLARDLRGQRDVVVKVLAPHWAEDADAIARFRREGLRLSRLRHPNIVALHDLGHDCDPMFIVMEHVDGEPLRHVLARRGPLNLRSFVPVAQQILAAVGYAHARATMLRDIKPSNVMLTDRGGKADFVKLLDFGLAKLVDGDDVDAIGSHVLGTAGYVAPEQIQGQRADVRVDVYALGILFFEMLTGVSPIAGDSDGSVLYNHVHGTARTLEDALPQDHGIPTELITLIHSCLAKIPAERPADANEIADALFGCVPADCFALPPATDETRRAIAAYRTSRARSLLPEGVVFSGRDGADPLSAEWTRPMLRGLLAAEGPETAAQWLEAQAREAQADDVDVEVPVAATSPAVVDTASQRFAENTPPFGTWLLAAVVAVLVGASLAYMILGHRSEPPTVHDDLHRRSSTQPAARHRSAAAQVPNDVMESVAVSTALAGLVVFELPAEAMLMVDGSTVGLGPFVGELAIGRHNIRVLWDGHEPWEQEVSVTEGENPPLLIAPVAIRGNRAARTHKREAEPTEQIDPPDDVFLKPQNAEANSVFLPVGTVASPDRG